MTRTVAAIAAACVFGLAISAASAETPGMTIEARGDSPRTEIAVTSPGVYKAVVWQVSGGGSGEFYNLASDPEAKRNLAFSDRGLLDIGCHGRAYKGPDREDCCIKHFLLKRSRHVKDAKTGEMVRDLCSEGSIQWPGPTYCRKALGAAKAPCEVEVVEQSPARVRVRVRAPFVWNEALVHDLGAAVVYTFWPAGRIVAQVRVQNPGRWTYHWSTEFGPHVWIEGKPDYSNGPAGYYGFVWSSPRQDKAVDRAPSGEFFLAKSAEAKTDLMLSIPRERDKMFPGTMVYLRVGYASTNIDMPPGYDDTWPCLIQMGSPASTLAPELKSAKDALPFALDYREPAKVTGATVVTDDPGDFNKDGFNESEGCYVLKGPGPLTFTFEKGKGAGFAPAFKILHWDADAPKSVKIDGKDVPFAAGTRKVAGATGRSPRGAVSAVMVEVQDILFLQVLGTVAAEKAQIEIAK